MLTLVGDQGQGWGPCLVGKTRKQMIGDREMPEDCRSPEKAPHPVKKVRVSFLEEGVFELGRRLGGGKTEGRAFKAEGQRKVHRGREGPP